MQHGRDCTQNELLGSTGSSKPKITLSAKIKNQYYIRNLFQKDYYKGMAMEKDKTDEKVERYIADAFVRKGEQETLEELAGVDVG